MTSNDRTAKSKTGRATSVPPPKDHYPAPDEEERSVATQVAADRWLTGEPTINRGEAK